MLGAIRRIAPLVAILFLAVAYVRGQVLYTVPTQVQGNDFVVREWANGKIGKVYLFGGSAHTACLDGRSGKVIWSVEAPGLSQQASPGAGPVLADKTLVYMGGGGFFTAYGIDADTGKTKWSLDKRSAALAAGPNIVFLGTQGGFGILAIDSTTGKVKWEKRAVKVGGSVTKIVYAGGRVYTDSPWVWDGSSDNVATKLAADPGTVVATSGRVFLVRYGMSLEAVDAKTSAPLWKVPNPIPNRPETAADDFLAASEQYVVGAFYDGGSFEAKTGIVAAYDSASGQLLWRKKIASGTGLLPDPVSVDNRFVYVLEPGEKNGPDTTITAYSAKTGQRAWSFSARRLNGPVAPVGNIVFISSDAGKAPEYTTLYALDQTTGVLRWKFFF